MSKLKLISTYFLLTFFFIGSTFSCLLIFDQFFNKKTKNLSISEDKFKNINQVLLNSDFPEKISVNYYPDYARNIFGLNNKIFPINNRSNLKTYFCEEQGYLSSFKADRHGFNNPDEVLDVSRIDIALVGSSGIQGACTNKYTFRNNLTRLSKEKLSIANFSLGGSGPLLQLALLKEFGSIYQPKKVFFFWDFANLRNMQDEINSPLRNYLKKDFTQNLSSPQNKELADNYVKTYLNYVKSQKQSQGISNYERKLRLSMRYPTTYFVYKKLKRFIPLFYFDNPEYWVKKTLISRDEILTRRLPKEEYLLMGEASYVVMGELKRIVSEWNGEIVMIFLGMGGYESKPYSPKNIGFIAEEHRYQKNLVKQIAKQYQFKYFDFEDEIDKEFTSQDHVKGFSRGRGHFTDKGYQKASKILYKNLIENSL